MNNYKYLNVRDYGARGDGQSDDTKAIQAAFDAAKTISDGGLSATVFIPAGIYMVGSAASGRALDFDASGCKLTGGGTLKYRTGCNNSIVLRIEGDRNVIEWIRIDGNYSGGAETSTDGLSVTGKFNMTRNVYVFDLSPETGQFDPKGSSFVHFGAVNRLKRCWSNGGYESLKDGGNFNIARYCIGLEYGEKGYNNADESDWTTVIGCYFASPASSTAGAAYQIDPKTAPFGRAVFRDCCAHGNEDTPLTTNIAKFTVIKDVYLDGCQFLHATDDITTLRFAEEVGRVRVKDTFLSRNIWVESDEAPYVDEMRLERVVIGDGTHQPPFSLNRGKCDILLFSDSTVLGYETAAIEWWGATYTLVAAVNCDFRGNSSALVNDIRPVVAQGGQVDSSRFVEWLGNRRSNTGGGATAFIDVPPLFVGREILSTTRDASLRVLEWPSDPSGTAVTWSRGDIVANASPTSGGYYGWVCTSVGPPIVWKQYALIS